MPRSPSIAVVGSINLDLVARCERLPRPVTLAAIKADPAFAGWDLVRLPRLSVMPVPPALWRRILAMGG